MIDYRDYKKHNVKSLWPTSETKLAKPDITVRQSGDEYTVINPTKMICRSCEKQYMVGDKVVQDGVYFIHEGCKRTAVIYYEDEGDE